MHPSQWLFTAALNLPKKWDGRDFQEYIRGVFGAFKAETARLTETDYVSATVRAHAPLMGQLCELVERALAEHFQGAPHRAFDAIDRCFAAIGPDHLAALCSPHDLPESLDFLYRMRISKQQKLTRGDLFHIPLNLRRQVRPQRYGVPGLPSLSLGGSVYVCWEEMQCPDLNSLHVSRFAAVPGANLRVLEFGYRPALMAVLIEYYQRRGDLDRDGPLARFVVAYCLIWPLLAASAVRVRDREQPFKPEYVVPNLILQWIAATRRFDGVRYFSMNVDEKYDDPMACANFVFPAQTSAASGYCPRLAAAFHLSPPVPWRLATGLPPTMGAPPHCNWKIELITGIRVDYINTHFGAMQAKIADLATGPVEAAGPR